MIPDKLRDRMTQPAKDAAERFGTALAERVGAAVEGVGDGVIALVGIALLALAIAALTLATSMRVLREVRSSGDS